MSEDRVVEALKALRDADRFAEAGPDVEDRVMRAFAARRRRPAPLWIGVGAAALAAAAAGFVLLHTRRAEVPQAPSPPVVAAVAAPSAPPAVKPPPRPPQPRRDAPKPWVLHEVDTEFYPLMETAPPFERGELVRMTVPASTMLHVGLVVDVNHLDDPVQADVLFGQEGLARAIRFVSYEMKERKI